MSTKGRSDYYAPGDYNACCDRCCAKFKASKLKRDWKGLMLCEWCWEPRHPQDFVRGLTDPTPVPWTRMCCGDSFVTLCVVPSAAFTVSVDATDPLTIHYASTTPSTDACPVTCAYDFGDGGTSDTCSGTYTYAGSGTYTISYTASSDGGDATVTEAVTVTQPAPTAPCVLGQTYVLVDLDSVSADNGLLTTTFTAGTGVMFSGNAYLTNLSFASNFQKDPFPIGLDRPDDGRNFIQTCAFDGSGEPNYSAATFSFSTASNIRAFGCELSGAPAVFDIRLYNGATLLRTVNLSVGGWDTWTDYFLNIVPLEVTVTKIEVVSTDTMMMRDIVLCTT